MGSGAKAAGDGDAGIAQIETVVLCRELQGGAWTVQPLAEPNRVSFGHRDVALTRLERFLEKHLVTAPTRLVARYGLPDGIELTSVVVPLERHDLPKRLRRPLTVRVPCIMVPQGRDAWVMIPGFDHTFFLARGEQLEEGVVNEVRRLVAARGAWTYDALSIFPAEDEELQQLTVLLSHEGEGLLGKARSVRKRKLAEHQKKRALEVLHQVAAPLHRSPNETGRGGTPHVGREDALDRLDAILGARARASLILVGEEGVGKSALTYAWCARARKERRLVFATSAAQLVAGMSGFGEWQERVTEVALAAEQLDAVLYFENLAELFGERPRTGGVDVAGALRPYVVNGRIRVVGELTPAGLQAAGRHQPTFIGAMSQLRLPAASADVARDVLRAHVSRWAKRPGPALDPGAIEPIVELADRYLPYRAFPGKAVRFAAELLSGAGDEETVGVPRAYEAFSVMSGIPAFLLRPDHPLSTDRIVAGLRRRVVGQHEAVRRVAETLSVVKARMQPEGKPLCTFLFVGPTGVGKTEVARALSALLFGSEERMARFDMSEYADVFAAERLIRGSDRESGALTGKVREQPFCVLLLDEIEKAHPSVFDLLLQVLGEGRLTDARGRTTFFDNAIIILTSNLGAADQRAPIGLRSREPDANERYLRAVHDAFRPELIGRLDRVVIFEPLSQDELERVTGMAIRRIADRRGLTENGVALEVSDAARAHLARGGYDPRYGVRALRRHLDDALVTPLGRVLARLGPTAFSSLAWVGLREEAPCPTASTKNRVASVEVDGLVFELYQRAAAGGRRALSGVEAVAEVRREIDVLMDRDEVRGVVDHFDLLRAQLATARTKKKRKGRKERDLSSADIELLRREHHRVQEALERIDALRGDVRATEQLCLTALFEGEPVEEWTEEARGLAGHVRAAVARLILAPRHERDEVTVALFEPDGSGPLGLWLEPLLAEAPKRGWTLTFHERKHGPHGEGWPAVRPFGPPRDAAWARTNLLSGRHKPIVMQARGRDAGLWITLEAGMHRIFGFGEGDGMRHLEVRLIATGVELGDAKWCHVALRRRSVAPRRGVPVARQRDRRGRELLVHDAHTVCVGPDDYWARIEEIGFAEIIYFYDRGLPDALWRSELDEVVEEAPA